MKLFVAFFLLFALIAIVRCDESVKEEEVPDMADKIEAISEKEISLEDAAERYSHRGRGYGRGGYGKRGGYGGYRRGYGGYGRGYGYGKRYGGYGYGKKYGGYGYGHRHGGYGRKYW